MRASLASGSRRRLRTFGECPMSDPYYHFVGSTLRDGRPVPPDGEWLVHDGPVEMCASGLHAAPSLNRSGK